MGVECLSEKATSLSTNQDIEHLRLLSIFHYVLAGFCGLFSCFPFIHVAFGIAIISGAFEGVGQGPPPPAALGWIFVIVPMIVICFGFAMTACMVITGRNLARHRSHTFCIVIAAIECIFMPLGTALGVFTLIVLTRPSVKPLFNLDSQP